MRHRSPPGSWLVTVLLAGGLGTAAWWGARGRPLPAPVHPAQAGLDMRIDLNRAAAAELNVLPGIGPRLADRIVADRRRNGPFSTINDLTRVRGVGPRTVDRIRPLALAQDDVRARP